MLRKIRITLAALFFVGITLLLAGIGRGWFGWEAKLQLLPATLRLIGSATLGNIAVVLGILLVTLLLGRIYCSVICPLGVFQDIVIWLRRTLAKFIKPLRKRFKFNKERRWIRYPVLAALIGCIIADLQLVVALIGPYSAFGRMVRSIVGGGPAPLLIAAAVGPGMVQHGLSRGHAPWLREQIPTLRSQDRRRQMRGLRNLRPRLQGLLHR